MTEVLVWLVPAIVVCIAGVVLILNVRRIRRAVARWRQRIDQVRIQLLPHGPRRDTAVLRVRLAKELQATRDLLESTPDGLVFRANAAGLLAEITATAAALDRELAAIERFVDTTHQREALATIKPQTMQVIEASYSARQTVLRTAVSDRMRRVASLQADVAHQAAALENYERTNDQLNI